MKTIVKRWGGSKAFIIPEPLADQLEIDVGDSIEVEITKKEMVSGFGLFKKAKPFSRDEKDLDRKI